MAQSDFLGIGKGKGFLGLGTGERKAAKTAQKQAKAEYKQSLATYLTSMASGGTKSAATQKSNTGFYAIVVVVLLMLGLISYFALK